MIEFLNWLGLCLAGLMGAAVTVATWEYLRRQTLVEPHLHAALLGSAGRALNVDVDVPLDALASTATGAAEPLASQTLMSQTLNRASSQARHGREASPWLDTEPGVALGLVDPPLEAAPMLNFDLQAQARHPAMPAAAPRPAAPEIAPRPAFIPQAQTEPAERATLR